MIKSMTGFGSVTHKTPLGRVSVEVRTVNHKYFDLSQRLPTRLYALEDLVKKAVQKQVSRGKVTVTVTAPEFQQNPTDFSLDRDIARRYVRAFQQLKKELKLTGELSLSDLIGLQGVVVYTQTDQDPYEYWPSLEAALSRALKKLVADRQREGRALSADFSKRIRLIAGALARIRERSRMNVEEYRHALAEKIKTLANTEKLDKGRLEFEVALFAKNCDITEEIVRLGHHLKGFGALLRTGADAGKQLDFIAQEMHRETNTIGSKSNDFKITQQVILIKGEIERIREQLKNIE